MNVYGVVGWKNAGKTGLMERLVTEIVARGFSVSTVKHAHHSFDVDHPGKDSYRHRAAGAREVLLASRNRFAMMHELTDEDEPALADLLAKLAPVDLVLVEGYKRDSHPKIEAHRGETGNPLIGDETVRAFAADSALDVDRPLFDLDDTGAIADFLLADLGLPQRQMQAEKAPENVSSLPDASPEVAIEEQMLGQGAPLAPPPLSNDCFALPAGVDWTPVDTALAMLRDRLKPVAGQITVDVTQAAGLVLARDVQARRSNPPDANTAVDGYGFAHSALGAPPHNLPLMPGRAAAGVPFRGAVPMGQALRVLTGARLPEGVDTVVLEEDTRTDGSRIAFNGRLKAGANTRRAGEDVVAGDVILREGRRLTPADLALLSATGRARVYCRTRLRVGVLSTGDELVEVGATAASGQIYDANRPMLLAQLGAWGFDAVDLGRAPDERTKLARMLDDAAMRCDAVLTSGGASAGDEDHMSALLAETGSLAMWRIALKPGRPLALGVWNGVPVFGLPGNPVAALVCTLIFAKPALGLLAGEGWHAPQGFRVPAAFTKSKKAGRREFLRARIRDGQAEVFKSEGSGRISGLSWAEGLVELPDDAMQIEPGTSVRYIPFSGF